MLLLEILKNQLFPVMAMLGIGALLGGFLYVQARELSRLIFYVFGPSLIFAGLVQARYPWQEMGRVGLFVLLNLVVTGTLAWGIARLFKLPLGLEVSLMMGSMFTNSGNYGLPVNLFAFGQSGLDHALLFFAASSVCMYSIGLFIASRNAGGSWVSRLATSIRLPIFWVLIISLSVQAFDIQVPKNIISVASTLGQAMSPCALLALGMQLQQMRLQGNFRWVAVGSFIRQGLAPLIAVGLASLVGLTGVGRAASITEASMPSAVVSLLLVIEYDGDIDTMSGIIFVTTLVSPLVLTVVLAWLQNNLH